MAKISIIGTGFVADLYMRSLETFPDIKIVKVFDKDKQRIQQFADFWKVNTAENLDELYSLDNNLERPDLILNLTNPG